MNFFTYAITLTALLLGCLALSVAHAESNDTYNFYFQKAPGPTTVNQGSATATDKKSESIPSVNVTTAPATATEEAPTKRSFYLTLGYALQNVPEPGSRFDQITGKKDQFLGSAYAVKAELDLTEHFGLTAEVYRLKNEPDVGLGRAYNRATQDFSYDVKGAAPRAYVRALAQSQSIGRDFTHSIPSAVITTRPWGSLCGQAATS